MRRQLLFVITIVAFGLLAELSVEPVAAATCYGSACNGLTAVSTGCGSGSQVLSVTPIYDVYTNEYIGEVQILWSPTCQTAWAHLYSGGDLVRPYRVQATITSTNPFNSYTQTNYYNYMATSPMVYAADVSFVSACGNITDDGVYGSACSP